MGDLLKAQVLRIRGLHLILLERLHIDHMFGVDTTLNLLGHFSFVCEQ